MSWWVRTWGAHPEDTVPQQRQRGYILERPRQNWHRVLVREGLALLSFRKWPEILKTDNTQGEMYYTPKLGKVLYLYFVI